jgi:co-chaperonin GroES (HSP10)
VHDEGLKERESFSKVLIKRKEPPGNRAALSSGRIVPTEAKPSELSGCIVGAGDGSVKDKSVKK